jgi:hypothetical protein
MRANDPIHHYLINDGESGGAQDAAPPALAAPPDTSELIVVRAPLPEHLLLIGSPLR